MPSASDAFRLEHGGEIREALIMLEGGDGGFELLAYGWLGGESTPFALVRSCASTAIHLLIDSGERDPRHPCRSYPAGGGGRGSPEPISLGWRPIADAALHSLQQELLRVSGTNAAPGCRG